MDFEMQICLASRYVPFLTDKAHTSCVFDPINDCFVLNDISPISLRKNLTFLSVNGMIVSECQLLQCQIKSDFP